MADAPPSPTLADLVTLAAALRQDQRLPEAQRRSLDRELGPAVSTLRVKPARQLTAWARAVADRTPEVARAHRQASAAQAWAVLLAAGLGTLLGVGVALGVFYYDGSSRINVLAVLAVFVLLPLLLLLPLLIAMLPARLASAVPGVGPLAELCRGVSVGRVAAAGVRLLPRGMRDRLAWTADTLGSQRTLYAHVQKWAILAWSQVFAVMFTAAAIVTLLVLVVLTDLAFGWSTTLDVEAADVHRLTDALATPWAATGQAVPGRELVEASRYFRMDAAQPPPADPAALGAWWRFLVAAMACYGLLPRVVMLGVCLAVRRRAVHAALRATPGAGAVLRRLHQTAVAFDAEGDAETPRPPAPDMATITNAPAADVLIIWADAPIEAAPSDWQVSTDRRMPAGGKTSVAGDRAVIEAAASRAGDGAVGVLVKAWEPPMGELLDFLRALREALGDGVEVTVLPVGEATAGQRAAWPRRLATLRDPWLRVVEPTTSADSAEVPHA
ncbi:MAG: DUF2868 domain-containing protein [Planctomycetes bacterium]|jgi:hypothetical protein|nr:DUF2868 domain-containing protein [Planctomycetota bacterium]